MSPYHSLAEILDLDPETIKNLELEAVYPDIIYLDDYSLKWRP